MHILLTDTVPLGTNHDTYPLRASLRHNFTPVGSKWCLPLKTLPMDKYGYGVNLEPGRKYVLPDGTHLMYQEEDETWRERDSYGHMFISAVVAPEVQALAAEWALRHKQWEPPPDVVVIGCTADVAEHEGTELFGLYALPEQLAGKHVVVYQQGNGFFRPPEGSFVTLSGGDPSDNSGYRVAYRSHKLMFEPVAELPPYFRSKAVVGLHFIARWRTWGNDERTEQSLREFSRSLAEETTAQTP